MLTSNIVSNILISVGRETGSEPEQGKDHDLNVPHKERRQILDRIQLGTYSDFSRIVLRQMGSKLRA